MYNSIKAINNISMRGNLVVTTWNNMKPTHHRYKTTRAQDLLVKEFLKGKTEACQESGLSKGNSDFIQKLFEYFTGKTFNNNSAKKSVINHGNEIYIHDNNFKLTDGVEFFLEM